MGALISRFAYWTARQSGRPIVFMEALASCLLWAVMGPVFDYSAGWMLVINTGTTIVTFLLVFLVQGSQNRDGAAIQAKLDELIRATADARNQLIGLEAKTEDEIKGIRADCP